ncbi:MAG: CDP-alcohol phosphatidyltransferase family protein [Alphaproteobacteria bacterium]|nr:CDP-alcohol phosphatidyltransferase family protein [Alphaproteobacteria bacterium]
MTTAMNVPNLITLARLLSVPLIVSLILSHQLMAALVFFSIAGLSDALDGFLARIFKSRTTLGAYLDPIADKALLVGVFAALGHTGLAEIWVVVLVVFRDVLIVGGIILLFLFKNTVEMKPLMISKINTVVQLTYALVILAQGDFLFNIPHLSIWLGYMVAFTTVISAFIYVRLALKYFNKMDVATL